MENMTAKVSCFASAYHQHGEPRVFTEGATELLLGQEDYKAIRENMAQGSHFSPRNSQECGRRRCWLSWKSSGAAGAWQERFLRGASGR